MGGKNSLSMIGAVLAVLGLIGLAVPVITTQETKEVARIGDLKLEATQQKSYPIPTILSAGALALGVILIGAAAIRR
jgi:hypothetical protein